MSSGPTRAWLGPYLALARLQGCRFLFIGAALHTSAPTQVALVIVDATTLRSTAVFVALLLTANRPDGVQPVGLVAGLRGPRCCSGCGSRARTTRSAAWCSSARRAGTGSAERGSHSSRTGA